MDEEYLSNMEPYQPHNLPGIDVDNALKRLGLDWKQYLGLLHRFAEDVKSSLRSLRDCVDRQEWENARRHALTISVASMKLCADNLRSKAHEVDQAIRNQASDASSVTEKLESQIQELADAISGSSNPFEDAAAITNILCSGLPTGSQ